MGRSGQPGESYQAVCGSRPARPELSLMPPCPKLQSSVPPWPALLIPMRSQPLSLVAPMGEEWQQGSGTGAGGVGPRRVLQPSGRGRGEAELPLGSFGRGKGPVPTLGKSQGGGRQEHTLTVFRAPGWGCLTEAPGAKRMETEGPRPNWHRATHIPAKPAAFIFSSLS